MSIEFIIAISAVVTTGLSLATAYFNSRAAYLNFQTAQQIVNRQNRKQRWLPWR